MARRAENEEICEAGRLAKLDFIINAVFNSKKEVKGIVAGHFKKAHQIGCDMSLSENSMHFNCALNITLLYLSRVNIIMVSKDIDKEKAARFGFNHAKSLDEGIKKVSEDMPQATVNIIPSGGLIIPIIKEEESFNSNSNYQISI